MKKNFSIPNFPNDKIKRVIYLYGCLKKNTSEISSSPLIQVCLNEINENDNSLLNNFVFAYVHLKQLSTAKLGSIWRGQNLILDNYNFYNSIVSRSFNFNFRFYSPKVITYDSINSHIQKKIFDNKFSLPNISSENFINDVSIFKDVNYSFLKSLNEIDVIIPPYLILEKLFCNNSSVKEKLLSQSIDQILNKYIEYLKINVSNFRAIEVKRKKSLSGLSNRNLQFLIELATNSYSRRIISIMQKSLEYTLIYQKNNQQFPRYPIILPPHEKDLQLHVKGVWLDNYQTFFVTQITKSRSTDHLYTHVSYI